MKKKILIVSGGTSKHIRRFLHNLSAVCGETISFDLYAYAKFDNEDICDLEAKKVYTTKAGSLIRKLIRLPKIGIVFSIMAQCHTLSSILKKNHYNLVNIHQLPFYSYCFVRIAHQNNIQVMLTPWGSDVLRVSKIYIPSLRKAFDIAQLVSGDLTVGFTQKVMKIFSIQKEKIVNLGYGSDVISSILALKGKFTREQLENKLGIPKAEYYITIGYNANRSQRHLTILRAIVNNKDILPPNYRLIIPLTYGTDKDLIIKKVRKICEEENLNAVLLTHYLTTEQVACLRLITDLFIHIQPTDAYNASLQESLLAGAQCINGKWLEYPTLETHGIPYHVCENLETLSMLIGEIVQNKVTPKTLHPETETLIIEQAWDKKIKKWVEFYQNL